MKLLVVFSTFPDETTARAAAEAVVHEHLAVCVNLVPGVESLYRWEGKVNTSREVLAIIKTTAECYPVLEKRLHDLHPYQVPEVLAFPAPMVSEKYLAWVKANTPP